MEFYQITDAEIYVRIVNGKIVSAVNLATPEPSPNDFAGIVRLALVFDLVNEFEPDALITVDKDDFMATLPAV
jgi:hypothetical protein